MTFHVWIAFLFAAGIVLIMPGPVIISVVSHSLAHGRRAVIPMVAGVTLGDLTAMSVSLLGLGTLLSASATLFSILKFIGALYLIFLGVKLWLSDPGAGHMDTAFEMRSKRSLACKLFLTTTLNPKTIAFFVAFLPQFVNPAAPVRPQLLILGTTFLVMSAINSGSYGFFAGRLREKMQSRSIRRWINRCGGTALIGAGVLTATVHRS